jgi:hypothetical protein
VIRRPRPALALMALVGVVIASGCGGSSATPTPPPISDPHEVITQAIAHTPAVKSLHIKIEVGGSVNVGSLTGLSSTGLSGNVELSGTTLEGDVDVTKQAIDLKLAVPGLFGTTGEVIVIDGYVYTKVSILSQGDKFTKSKLSDKIPVSIPSPGAIASGALTDQVDAFRKVLTDAGAVATFKPDDKVGGKDAYHVSISLPLAKINSMLGAQGGSVASGITLDSASVEIWVYKENDLPAKIEIKASAGAIGNLDVVVTLSNYDQAVTIKAPADSDVQAS